MKKLTELSQNPDHCRQVWECVMGKRAKSEMQFIAPNAKIIGIKEPVTTGLPGYIFETMDRFLLTLPTLADRKSTTTPSR